MIDPAISNPSFRHSLVYFARVFARPSAWFGMLAVLTVLFACQLGSTPETKKTFSFPTLKDKIGDADQVLIVLKDSSGKLVDVLYDGAVDSTTRFEDLTAPNYHGGKVYIHIEATKGGQTIYKVQRGYDPARGGDLAQETIVHVDPSKIPKDTVPKDTTTQAGLRLLPDTLVLALRGPTGRFTVEFPSAFIAGPLVWVSLDPGVDLSTDGLITPKAQGLSRVVAAIQAHAAVKDTAWVKVLSVQPVDSIRFEKRSTTLLVQGSPDSLRLRVHPQLAPPGVLFTVRDTSRVRLAGSAIQGLKEGETQVYAHSLEDPTKRDSLTVVVLSPRPADSVSIQLDTLKLFVKGPSQTLTASIHPSDLAPLFLWSSLSPTIAAVDGQGLVTPVSQGQTQVVARSWADSTKEDRVIVLVKKDIPRILAGNDTILAKGSTLIHNPSVTQEYGQVAMFKWDLDGNGAYEDSATAVRTGLPFTYTDAKEYAVRFYVRDTEGNDTVQIRRVKAVSGRVVQITSPKDGSATNVDSVNVTWTVDGNPHSSTEKLRAGANVLMRSAQDSAGNTFSHSITVVLDQAAPRKPGVMGPTLPVNTTLPRWSWKSDDTSGSGTFRYRLDNPDLSAAPGVTDTVYIASSNLAEGIHTLYVQERDDAGNWSASGSFAVRIDLTAPTAPTLQIQQASPTNESRPTWTWAGPSGNALQYYRFKLDDNDFRTGAKDTLGNGFRPPVPLSEGSHTLYVQARDTAGNWSASGSFTVRIDLTAPAAPTVQVQPTSPTNESRPTWSWSGTTGNTRQYYRFKLDNSDFQSGARDTVGTGYRPPMALGDGPHTLYVQARDSAGNWSTTASAAITVDLAPPAAPRFDATPYSPLNSLRPRWTWRSGGGGVRRYRTALSAAGLATAPEQTDSSFTPAANLAEAGHTLYVQERDAAGNWSTAATKEIVVAIRKSVGEFFSGGFEVFGFQSDAQGNIIMVNSESDDASPLYRVRRFNGSEWQDLGDPSPLGRITDHNALAVSRTGTPYIIMDDSSWQAFVAQPSGNRWTRVGTNWALDRYVYQKQVAISNSDVLHVAYLAGDGSGAIDRIVVKRLNGQNWETMSTKNLNASAELHALSISTSGAPIIFYIDGSFTPPKLMVQRVNAGNAPWEDIGNLTVYKHYGNSFLPMVNTSEDSLFIALREDETSNKNSVQKFNGSNWIPLGSMPDSEISTHHPLLAVSPPPSRNKYFSFFNQSAARQEVRVFRDNQWVLMAGLQLGDVKRITTGKDGVPYLVSAGVNQVSVWKASFDP